MQLTCTMALGYRKCIKTKYLLDNSLIHLLGGGYETYSPQFNLIRWFECTMVKNYILQTILLMHIVSPHTPSLSFSTSETTVVIHITYNHVMMKIMFLCNMIHMSKYQTANTTKKNLIIFVITITSLYFCKYT